MDKVRVNSVIYEIADKFPVSHRESRLDCNKKDNKDKNNKQKYMSLKK